MLPDRQAVVFSCQVLSVELRRSIDRLRMILREGNAATGSHPPSSDGNEVHHLQIAQLDLDEISTSSQRGAVGKQLEVQMVSKFS